FLFVSAGRNINPGPNLDRILDASNRAPSFALDVVCRQSLARKSGKVRLLVVQRFASESKNFVRSKVTDDCLADAIDIGSQPSSAAVVVHDDFEKIRVFAELGVVL